MQSLLIALVAAGVICFSASPALAVSNDWILRHYDWRVLRRTGVIGKVEIGPMCPVVTYPAIADCADRPYQATIAIQNSDGQEITRIRSRRNGKFRLRLRPGVYQLVPLYGGNGRFSPPYAMDLPHASPQTVVVEPGDYTRVTITYDSGIR